MASIIALPNDYVVIDLETTGLDYEFDDIIEISGIRYQNGQETARYEQLVHIEYPLPSFITDLTGISNDMLVGCPNISQAISEFSLFLGPDIIIGHNINFDMHFLSVAYNRHLNRTLENKCIDTMRISRKVIPELSHHRLCDIAGYYGVPYEGAHRSSVDCEITNACYQIMRNAILSSYTETDFQALFTPHPKINKANAKNIQATVDNFDPDHPLYGKNVVFTGALSQMTRAEAMQIVANCGGICANGVTKNTNYLVVGTSDYISATGGKKTSKMLKVEQLRAKGYDVSTISEKTFFDFIGIK